MGYRDYSTAYGHIVDSGGHGDYTTIQSAITASSSGQTIFIRPGTYTENLTLKAGVDLVAYEADALTPNVTIDGKCTATFAGTASISGIRLKTNSDFCLAVTGNSATIINLTNCFIQVSNNNAISYSSSSGSSIITFTKCTGNIDTTGIVYLISSGSGIINIDYCRFSNSGGSVTASTISAGIIEFRHSSFANPITSSGTGGVSAVYSNFQFSGLNVTALTVGGSGTHRYFGSRFVSDTATAIVVTSAMSLTDSEIISSNTNAISGAGNITYGNLVFTNSSIISTTTQTKVFTQLGMWKASGQPAFLARSASQSDVTGDGTTYTIQYTSEIFDQNNNFDGTSTFTAPVTGVYYLDAINSLAGLTVSHTGLDFIIVTSNRSYTLDTCNPGIQILSTFYKSNGSVLADMDAADTATVTISVSGSTKVVDVTTTSTFCAELLA